MEKLNHSEKKTIEVLNRLIDVAKKHRQYPLSCNEGIFEDIKTLGIDANGEVRSLSFYRDVDLPSPYDIPSSSTGTGIFTDKQAMKRVIKNSIAWIREIKKRHQGQLQPWNDKATEYMNNSEAVVTFTKSKLPLPKLSKILKPDGPIRYMRKGRRCKVHIGDFRKLSENIVYKRYFLSDKVLNEYVDEVMSCREAEKEEIRASRKSCK